jgi:histidine ammonia-lyase
VRVVTITSAPLGLEDLLAIADGAQVSLADDARAAIVTSRAVIDRMLESTEPVYGLNTGVGHMKDSVLPAEELRSGQEMLLMTHAGGTGPPLPTDRVRGAMAARGRARVWPRCSSRC